MTSGRLLALLFAAAAVCLPGRIAAGAKHEDGTSRSKTRQELIEEGRRRARALDSLSDRLESLAAAHDAGRPSGLSPQERDDLRWEAEQGVRELQDYMHRYWTADDVNRFVRGTTLLRGFVSQGAAPGAGAIGSVFDLGQFPKTIEHCYERAEAVLHREEAAYVAAVVQRAAARKKRLALAGGCAALAAGLAFWYWKASSARRPSGGKPLIKA